MALQAQEADMAINITADTTLTVATHAGRILLCNDADGKFTLPSIKVNSNGATAGDTDFNNLNNIMCIFPLLCGNSCN